MSALWGRAHFGDVHWFIGFFGMDVKKWMDDCLKAGMIHFANRMDSFNMKSCAKPQSREGKGQRTAVYAKLRRAKEDGKRQRTDVRSQISDVGDPHHG